VRLQKLLAEAGLGSRRQIETWIEQARLSINGTIARLGDRAVFGDSIRLDGNPVTLERMAVRVLAYHKPVGEIVTRKDPQGRNSVFEHLPRLAQGKWVAVGRLDYNTSGLLLLTNSGDLANRLMHPRYAVERTYEVRAQGVLGEAELERLRQGVEIGDGPAAFESIEASGGEGSNRWYRVRLREGRNREVRRMFAAVDRRVNRLIRVQYGPVPLPRELAPGAWRELSNREIALLRETPKPGIRPKPRVVRDRQSC
jgi:23S rRNA pseudouridine2605 synthase